MSSTKQPKWEYIGNLGDVHPLDYGATLIFRDKTGVYPPEAMHIEPPAEDDKPGAPHRVYRAVLEPCTYQNGILSDNPYHPDYPVWFSRQWTGKEEIDGLGPIAETDGVSRESLIQLFLSDDTMERASAWTAIAQYHGWENLDDYPAEFSRGELSRWFRAHRLPEFADSKESWNRKHPFVSSYLETALWSSADQYGVFLDKQYGIDDLHPSALLSSLRDCREFYGKFHEHIEDDLERAGHDFWLTRNGHGAGFWDGDWPEPLASVLTEESHVYGSVDLYVDDDGRIRL